MPHHPIRSSSAQFRQMTDDEALARALQASLNEPSNPPQTRQQVISQRCASAAHNVGPPTHLTHLSTCVQSPYIHVTVLFCACNCPILCMFC